MISNVELEMLNNRKMEESKKFGVIYGASPEYSTKYRKCKSDQRVLFESWLKSAVDFRNAHIGDGHSLHTLLEEAFLIGSNSTDEINSLVSQWKIIDSAKESEAQSGIVPFPDLIGNETLDAASLRVVRETKKYNAQTIVALENIECNV